MVEQVNSLRTGVKYKNTPIGKIPVDWEVVPLRAVSEINSCGLGSCTSESRLRN